MTLLVYFMERLAYESGNHLKCCKSMLHCRVVQTYFEEYQEGNSRFLKWYAKSLNDYCLTRLCFSPRNYEKVDYH